MSRAKRLLLPALAVLGLALTAAAADGTGPQISGRIRLFSSIYAADHSDGRFFSHEAGQFAFRRAEVRLKIAGSVNERVSYGARLDAFSYPGDLIESGQFPESAFLGSPASTEHFELSLYEGWVKVDDFLLKNLDLTVGKQRIAWGTADKIGVVDNLNPIDFANFLSFDPDYFFERRPQTGFNLEWYPAGSLKLQLVWLLQNQVSPLPYGYSALAGKFFSMSSAVVKKAWDDKAFQSAWGARASIRVLGLDLGASYYHGNLSLPYLRSLTIGWLGEGVFYYPWADIWGLDLAGELAGVGFWAEAAYIRPEKVTAGLHYSLLLNGLPFAIDSEAALFEPGYWKYVIGADYVFGGGVSVNVQYLHGFFDEVDYSTAAETLFSYRGGMFFGEPQDYVLGRLEWKFARDAVKLKAGGLLEIGDGRTALALMPEVELRIADALNVIAGAFAVVSGDRDLTKFGSFRDDGQAYLGLKLDF